MHTEAAGNGIRRQRRHAGPLVAAVVLLLLAAQTAAAAAHPARGRGVTSRYVRKHQASDDMPLDADVFAVPPGRNAPQQVHIGLADRTGTAMFVSWVTIRYHMPNHDDSVYNIHPPASAKQPDKKAAYAYA